MKVLQLFFILMITSCSFTYVIYKILMCKMNREKNRNKIMCELIKLESECTHMLDEINLKNYPKIETQIKEVSLILDRLTYDACIKKIKLVKIKDDARLKREYELLDRERRRLNNEQVNMVLLRKVIIINAIAQYNFPIRFYCTCLINMILEMKSNKVVKECTEKSLQYNFAN